MKKKLTVDDIIQQFKKTTDPDIHVECGMTGMNNILWANIVEDGERIPITKQTAINFVYSGKIQAIDHNDIEWLKPEKRKGGTEKIYRCKVRPPFLVD